jgi:O-methyltransferase
VTLLQTIPVDVCPLCRSSDHEVLYPGLIDRRLGVGGSWTFLRCRACAVVFQNPRPADPSAAYPPQYSQHTAPPPPRLECEPPFAAFKTWIRKAVLAASGYPHLASRFARIAGSILRLSREARFAAFHGSLVQPEGPPRRLLDLGCGNGFFVAWARLLGWDACGVEADRVSAAIAREVSGAQIHESLDALPLADGSLDVITANHVLEHLVDPAAALAHCRRLLRPGGTLYVGVPNWASWERRLFGTAWHALEPSRHLIMFDPPRLRRLLEDSGFEVKTMRTTSMRERGRFAVNWRMRFAVAAPFGVARAMRIGSTLFNVGDGEIIVRATSVAPRLSSGVLCGGGGPSASLPLLNDVPASPRRGASHPTSRRSQITPENNLDATLDRGTELYLDLLERVLTASIYEESGWAMLQPAAYKRSVRAPLRSLRAVAQHLIERFARKRGLTIVQRKPFDALAREEGRDWPLFGYTMVGHRRLRHVRHCVEEVIRSGVPGDLMETGVWRGGCVIYMRAILRAFGITDRMVWAADSFEGLPPPSNGDDGPDLSGVDFLKVSLAAVKANFERFDLLDDRVRFLPGWFADTLPDAPVEALAVLRLDGDRYGSTMDALVHLYPKVSPGGYVIVDDYGSWPSCRRAVTEYLEQNGLKPEIHPVDWSAVYWRAGTAGSGRQR